MSDCKTGARLPSDNPIRLPKEDLLCRTDAAADFVRQVLELDASEGAAVGIFGPWGSGKTSFVNLVKEALGNKQVSVIEFNPWLFSGAEQLAGRFFSELSAQMACQPNFKAAGEAFGKYGRAFSGPLGVLATAVTGVPSEKTC